ncbi:FAD:protein FMN transferase [Prosthecochloris sp. SCSIO W1103]|uniref:FAD:protein FMN transferase n=1 Tax=Prosthecochloris sp. SCSIO W1103 TaxID=2992244 RepID=UPI00223E6C8A|nr:FAD:protein FMN transferase [Prosthecochloris sp. SCSIO W1103]UZJ36521.1 FAD:protein FMN transferase [Prosthecochloris sp. SCSIO W1103]
MCNCLNHTLPFLLLSLTLLSCSGTDSGLRIYEQEKVMMGTVMKIKAVAEGDAEEKAQEAFDTAFREIAELESELSEWQPASPVSEVNRKAGIERVEVPEALVTVTQKALDIAEVTEGAFDVTFKPIGRLWNVKERTSPPPPDSIRTALSQVDYTQIDLDTLQKTLLLKKMGMEIGFGGIAKGYAALRAGEVLERYGIDNYIINAGGDLYVKGKKGERQWTSGIKNPDTKQKTPLIAFGVIKACGIATSGDYESYFVHEGIRYHHIIDLKTGYPARGIKSVTVFSEDPAKADAYATAFFILGHENALHIVEQDPSLAFILIDAKDGIFKSPNIGEFIEEIRKK